MPKSLKERREKLRKDEAELRRDFTVWKKACSKRKHVFMSLDEEYDVCTNEKHVFILSTNTYCSLELCPELT